MATAALAFLFLIASRASAQSSDDFNTGRASFSVRVGEETNPYSLIAVFLLPGETVSISAVDRSRARYELDAPGGDVERLTRRKFRWTAPVQHGLYPLGFANMTTGETVRLNAFVIVPMRRKRDGYLNGYRIGDYPADPLRDDHIYVPPRGFVEVTPENENTLVSPHFRIAQFVTKQNGGYPKYVVLRTRLLLLLERTLEAVNTAGYRAHTLYVMSGYRTPYYNELLGNVPYSRHLWGDASDIFVDACSPFGVMDDLDRDGKVDLDDAAVLQGIIDGVLAEPAYRASIGGLARYPATRSHGPFVHVDVRGRRARWNED